MVTENNSLINTFVKGIDSDSSYLMINNLSYLYAENLRILSQVNNSSETDIQYGELRSIQGSKLFQAICSATKILASVTIRNYGIVIHQTDGTWRVTRIIYDYDKHDVSKKYDEYKIKTIFNSGRNVTKNKYSVVGRYEDDDNIKIYIADGDNPIVCINISENQDEYNLSINADNASAYPQISFNPIQFVEYIQGNIKPGMVQYSYRLYKKNSVYTDASPLTKLYPIYNIQENIGCTLNEQSNCGIKFKINIPSNESKWFDKILIYRIEYIQNGQLPIIELIKDEWIHNRTEIILSDIGQLSLLTISIEEFNSFSGIHIIPTVLESQNDYLFAGKIKSDNNIDELIEDFDTRAIRFNRNGEAKIYNYPYSNSDKGLTFVFNSSGDLVEKSTRYKFSDYYKDHDCFLLINDYNYSYNDTDYKYKSSSSVYGGEGLNISWLFVYYDNLKLDTANEYDIIDGSNKKLNRSQNKLTVSLRRGELYRYGIVFYNKLGECSSAKWICDIRVPYDHECLYVTSQKTYLLDGKINTEELKSRSVGVLFKLDTSNLNKNIVAYEIVRCNRTSSDIKNITQGVLSRPIRRYETMNKIYGIKEGSDGYISIKIDKEYPYTPTGYITTSNWWTGKNMLSLMGNKIHKDYREWGDPYEAMNYSTAFEEINNYDTFQFISPECIYNYDSTFLEIDKSANAKLYKVADCYKNITPNNTYEWKYLYEQGGGQGGYYQIYKTDYITEPSFGCGFISEFETRNNEHIGNTIIRPCGDSYFMWDRNEQMTPHFNLYSPMKYSYLLTNNKDNTLDYTNQTDFFSDPLSSRSWYDVTKYIYSYIKPYNVQHEVIHSTVDISDINKAEGLNYNEVLDSDSENSRPAYMDKVISIGDDSFCNVVIGGMYGVPVKNYAVDDKGYVKLNTASFTMHGSGGRCFIIKTKLKFEEACNVKRFGTVICNIQQHVIPYGGFDFNSRKLNSYYSTGSFGNLNKNERLITVFDGDTYLCPIEYVSMHKVYVPFFNGAIPSTTVIYSLPLESYVNPYLTSGNEFSRNYDAKEGRITNLQIEPSNVNNYYTLKKPLYEYNTAYSVENKTKIYPAYDEESIKDLKNTDYRVFHSNLKTNDEHLDSWLKFLTNDFIDVDSKYGPITELKSFNNRLYYWQENAVGILSVNERTVMNTENNMPLILGEGGVLTRYDYLDYASGMKEDQYCDVVTSNGLYYFDDYNNSIYRISQEGLVNLTDSKNVRNIMNSKRDTKNRSVLYDPAYKEVLFNVLNNGSIVYNEKLQQFTSIYTTEWNNSLRFNLDIYLLNIDSKNNIQADVWNKSGDTKPSIKFKYVVNKSPLITKVFDNQEIVTSTPIKDTFDKLSYSFKTDISSVENKTVNMTDREGNFRYAIPRSGDKEYGNRIKGKYMVCTIKGDAYADSAITYIITKFRGSLS